MPEHFVLSEGPVEGTPDRLAQRPVEALHEWLAEGLPSGTAAVHPT